MSIGCFKTIDDGVSAVDYCDVLDFGDNSVTAVTVENMYTEKSGSNVKLYTEIKVACHESDGLMNNMALNDDDCEIAIAKLINGEYLFTIVKEYDTSDAVIDGFAAVLSGLDDVPLYVNSAFDPLLMPYISVANMGEDLTEEERALKEEEARIAFWESEKLRRKIEEQRRIAEEAVAQKRLAEEAEEKLLFSPVSAPISDNYGNREETSDFNKGVNFAVPEGTPVYAAGKGTVLNADDEDNGYGLCVIIDHGSGGLATLYAHLSEISVKEGGEVNAGDLIGYSGKTGNTYGATLHFEVRVNGAHVDPMDYLIPMESLTPTPLWYESTESAVLAVYSDLTSATDITLYDDGTFLVTNYSSSNDSNIMMNRPEKEYTFENGILSLEYNDGSVYYFEAVGNDLVSRKDLSVYADDLDKLKFGSKSTYELRSGTSLNGGRIEMETMTLNGELYFLVSNETQLRAIGKSVYGPDMNYMQQCDIELSPDEWKAVGTRANPFTGSYNGNGFEIKGLTMADPYAPLIGMFGYAENANIYNITLRDYDIEKAGSKAKTKSVAPIVAINVGSRVYDNFIYPKE